MVVSFNLRDLRWAAIGIRTDDEGVSSLLMVRLSANVDNSAAGLCHRHRRVSAVPKAVVEAMEVAPKPTLSRIARKFAKPWQVVDGLYPNVRVSKHLRL